MRNSFAVSIGVFTVENISVSSANNLMLEIRPSGKSFMKERKRSGPKIKLCGTLAFIGSQLDVWPLIVTLWYLSERKDSIRLNSLPSIPKFFILYLIT